MRAVFADAGYWVAIVNSRDRLHATAAAMAEQLAEYRIVTSEMVLVELLNGFAEFGSHLRAKASELAHAVVAHPDIEAVPQSSELFRDALSLYRKPDRLRIVCHHGQAADYGSIDVRSALRAARISCPAAELMFCCHNDQAVRNLLQAAPPGAELTV